MSYNTFSDETVSLQPLPIL